MKTPKALRKAASENSKMINALVVLIPIIRGFHIAFLDTLKPISKVSLKNKIVFFLANPYNSTKQLIAT